MANTNTLIVGATFIDGGILTIPIAIGLICAPRGCLIFTLGLILPNPKQPVVYMQR